MSIVLSRVDRKTELFAQVTDQVFTNVIKGKIVREVVTSKGSKDWWTTIYFADGSAVKVEENHGRGMVDVRYIRSQAEQDRDDKLQ
jgi:hypothetical protein